MFLARDRIGIRPLFYSLYGGRLIFGSEIKSILAYPELKAEIDPVSLGQIFTFCSTLTPRTISKGIYEIPPAHCLIAREGSLDIRRYWSLSFMVDPAGTRTQEEYEEELENLLVDATCLRLRADIPVGAYLSGGLDSSLTTAFICKHTSSRLETFSVAFENPEFDESQLQHRMADFLGTGRRSIYCRHADIAAVFPDVIWHIEVPILRTAPAPLFLLSRLVHDNNLKVVLTGEGADEFLGGYDIFEEMKIRRFWAKYPESEYRRLLLRRLYTDIAALGDMSTSLLFTYGRKRVQGCG